MLNFPIVDTHLHVWDVDRIDYPWLANAPLLNKSYLLDEYNAATGPVEVDKMVFVQAEADFSQFHEEAEFVTELAQADPRIQGIVPWAPLEKGDAARQHLERLAANPLIKGIRRIIQFEDDLEFCLRPGFVKGVQSLASYNLSFDLCISHIQMGNTIRLVQQCPDVMFILDHIGKPDIRHQVFEPWKTQLRKLARMDNVWCKLSGLATEADFDNWTREDLKPYIDHVFECFGVERIMYGGDWPVSIQATTYPRWVETILWAVNGFSDTELRRLFRDNAIAFYRLPA